MKLASIKYRVIVGAVLAAILIIAGIWGISAMNSTDQQPAEPYNGHGGTFKNPLTDIDSPDPSVVYKDGYYYMTFTHNGADIMVMKSRTLDFKQAERRVVWYPPIGTMYSANIWAPEIQYIRGKWYIYFAADDGRNENHRMYALEADTDDPLGTYTFKGQVTDETNKWAIDGLVLEHDDKLYFIWSGWEGDVNIAQNTYIAPMSDPVTVSGPRVLLAKPELEWEKAGGPPYINEGQAILKKDGDVFLVYSGAGSWTPFYSLGVLTLRAGLDPLVPENWVKSEEPLMQMDQEAGVFGPGHNSFVKSPDGTQDWIVYHATSGIHDGWNNRKARAQLIAWDEQGMPVFGKPLSLDTAIPVPSGSGVLRAEHAVRPDEQSLMFDLVPATIDTEVPMLIHYKNDSGAPRTIGIEVNGAVNGEVELPAVGDGETGYVYAAVSLHKGMNNIALTHVESVQIQAIELTRYEAETAQAYGAGSALDNPFASANGNVRLERAQEVQLRFDNIRVPIQGEYELLLAVSNPGDQEETVVAAVNGKQKTTITVPPTGRNQYANILLKVRLQTDANEITLETISGRLDIDYLDIRR